MAVRYGDDMFWVDVGMGFPAESVYGVDVCIPDFEFLEEYRENIVAVVITHGHEDHIGALPYVLKKFNVPVYASHFTMGLIESKLEEHDLLNDVLLHRVEPCDRVEIGEFEVEFIRVSHSLVDCFALAISTPIGTLIHTGDYKVDETPVIGEPIDLRTLRRYGQEGVLALTSDSTNATVPGRTPSERAVIPDFEEIFSEAEGRIFVAAFASSIHRLQIVIDVAQQFDRKVCVLGRSMVKNVEIAERLGYLDLHEGMRSEEHTSELQSRSDLVCRLLLEKKKKKIDTSSPSSTQKSSIASSTYDLYHHLLKTTARSITCTSTSTTKSHAISSSLADKPPLS